MNSNPGQVYPLRCFPGSRRVPAAVGWVERWLTQFSSAGLQLQGLQEEALSRLIPLLLCGEQSAQQVFHRQANSMRESARSELSAVLACIEVEESAHERALQALATRVVTPVDLHLRKRRAQRFYSSLARNASLAQHFARIEALDSGVCRIMHSLSRAHGSGDHPLYHLFDNIKSDEARHVGVSRRYASMLGISGADCERERAMIGGALVDFLRPEAAAFECLGVDADRLFRRLESGALA